MLLEFFQRHRAGVVLLCMATFSFLCMSLRVSDTINALKSSVWFLVSPSVVESGEFFNTLDSSSGRLFSLVRSEGENFLLRKQNAQLSKRDVERDALEEENNRLRTLLQLKQMMFPTGIGAEVVGRDIRDWFRSMVINKGTLDKVNVSAAVVSGSVEKPILVGRVVEAKENVSKVLLLTDSLSAIAVSIVRTGDMGLLEGQNKPWVRLNYLPHLSNVLVGDQVVTVGLGGLFPPNIPVGVVTAVKESSDGFFKEATVEPGNLSSLRDVLVLERREIKGELPVQ